MVVVESGLVEEVELMTRKRTVINMRRREGVLHSLFS